MGGIANGRLSRYPQTVFLKTEAQREAVQVVLKAGFIFRIFGRLLGVKPCRSVQPGGDLSRGIQRGGIGHRLHQIENSSNNKLAVRFQKVLTTSDRFQLPTKRVPPGTRSRQTENPQLSACTRNL